MLLNCILISVLAVLTVATFTWFYADYRRAKSGKKSVFWVEKN